VVQQKRSKVSFLILSAGVQYSKMEFSLPNAYSVRRTGYTADVLSRRYQHVLVEGVTYGYLILDAIDFSPVGTRSQLVGTYAYDGPKTTQIRV